jgi:hypothetical protein
MADDTDLGDCVREALAAIKNPRFFVTERGFQGELLAQLASRLQLPNQAILEQEYQKRQQEHGLAIRPDIIIHEPYDPKRHSARTEGNYAVLELKLNATRDEAFEDFQSLATMIKVLRYPVGIFVNIASDATYSELIPQDVRKQIITFAVFLVDGNTKVIPQRSKSLTQS